MLQILRDCLLPDCLLDPFLGLDVKWVVRDALQRSLCLQLSCPGGTKELSKACWVVLRSMRNLWLGLVRSI